MRWIREILRERRENGWAWECRKDDFRVIFSLLLLLGLAFGGGAAVSQGCSCKCNVAVKDNGRSPDPVLSVP